MLDSTPGKHNEGSWHLPPSPPSFLLPVDVMSGALAAIVDQEVITERSGKHRSQEHPWNLGKPRASGRRPLSPETGWLGAKEQVWGRQAKARHCSGCMGLLPCAAGTRRWLANGGIWGETWLEVEVCRHKQRPLQSQRLQGPQTRGRRGGRAVRIEDLQENGVPEAT